MSPEVPGKRQAWWGSPAMPHSPRSQPLLGRLGGPWTVTLREAGLRP